MADTVDDADDCRPLLPQCDCSPLIKANNVESVLADIGADDSNRTVEIPNMACSSSIAPLASFVRWQGRSTAGPSHFDRLRRL
jgi:hypothetical protein